MTLSGDSRASSSPSSSAGGLAQQHYHKVLELEKLLVTTIQSKGPFDPNVGILRNNIRELFESIILEDHEFAELHDVEQSLWRLHHTRIEEFRVRIRKSMPSTGTASTSTSGNKLNVRREPVQKILAVFRSFLSEATGFYHDLILKIKAKHGLSQDDLVYGAINVKDTEDDDKRIKELKRCQLSSHRCLIYLGDLARYKEYYGDVDGKNRDWSIAAGFYVKAASLWPASGNPYNQLAVLATYIGDEMLAVYHYFRSLASETPFLTAKDNLVLLFEKNRHSYIRLVESRAGKPSQNTGKFEPVIRGKMKADMGMALGTGDSSSSYRQSDLPKSEQTVAASDIMKSFRVRVVRLNGILFTRTSLETFTEIHSCVLTELEQLLNLTDTDEEALLVQGLGLTSGRIWGTGPNVLLQLICILIFTVHNVHVSPGSDFHQPTYAEILQRSVILQHAFITTFECVGYLLQHCANTDDPFSSPLLPAALIVMEWLSCKPEIAVGTEIKEKEGNARTFFWKSCVDLLNRFSIEKTREQRTGAKEDNEEGSILWEDHELWGFIPLLPVQIKLNYTKKPTMGLGSLKEKRTRVKRLKQAGKVISNTFQGTDRGIQYDAETDIFYLTGDKQRLGRKQDNVVPTAEVPKSKNPHMIVEPLAKVAPSFDEEDEEVIVFKPSNKGKELIDPSLLEEVSFKRTTETTLTNTSKYGIGSKSVALSETTSDLTGIEELLAEDLPSMPTSATCSAVLSPDISIVQSLLPKPAVEIPVAVKYSQAMFGGSSAGLDSKTERTAYLHGLSMNTPFTVDEYQPGLVSGSLVDWGRGTSFGMFQNQRPRNSVPITSNWQPQDVIGGSSLWNSELAAVGRGSLGVPQNSSTLGMGTGYPFIDSFPGFFQNTVPTSAAHTSVELSSMPSMASSVLDAVVQPTPSDQESKLVTAEVLQAAIQDLSLSEVTGPKVKPDSGFTSDSEKPAQRGASLSSSMRPPPGFGPLPVKPSVSFPATSVSQASQLTSSGQPTTSSLVYPRISSDVSSTDEQLDDYGWLDGYIPPKREASKPLASRVVSNPSYGWLTSGFNPALEAAVSPFPGMKPSPIPTPQHLPHLPQAYLQQEQLRKQQTPEQYQQQLLQEHHRQQLQQLYNAQLAAQHAHQLQQAEQQQGQPPLQQQSLAVAQQLPQPLLAQQLPQPLWPGQNSFVS